jgi:hypothetical protein
MARRLVAFYEKVLTQSRAALENKNTASVSEAVGVERSS